MPPASSPATRLPSHLRQFVVDQLHERYTPVDHAVWRYILRQSVRIHRERAHDSYLAGLKATGIRLEAVPRIEEMNEILSRIGWGAVAVDGFIPPAAFMEFQAHRVLVIAADMRQIDHIEYTPAPDIVHEAAGHAPIIVDPVYSHYLQRIGEVGARAIASRKDHELYEAIRRLSIVKESRESRPEEIDAAQKAVIDLQNDLGEPSEMARLSRLHWWTVEYGLIGSLEHPRIYGAGLISSIGEAVSCFDPKVKKLPYGLQAADFAYDITRPQPQLFVTPSFEHLEEVLEQFASTMAFRVGGLPGLTRALHSQSTATAVFSSGLQVSGTVDEVIVDDDGRPAYLRTSGPTALALQDRQLDGHGRDRHRDGFGAPVGRLKSGSPSLEEIRPGSRTRLEFQSGVVVAGLVERLLAHEGRKVLVTFADCTVSMGDRILFRPEWGCYDMAVGAEIVSVFAGAADKDAFEPASAPRERAFKPQSDEPSQRLHQLYREVRSIRETSGGFQGLPALWRKVRTEHPQDWLLSLEILELALFREELKGLGQEVRSWLEHRASGEPPLRRLITDGLSLLG
jgi:phenylalanine-4-hydroxylase